MYSGAHGKRLLATNGKRTSRFTQSTTNAAWGHHEQHINLKAAGLVQLLSGLKNASASTMLISIQTRACSTVMMANDVRRKSTLRLAWCFFVYATGSALMWRLL